MPFFNKQEQIPSTFQRKTCWLALTGISGAVVVALVIGFFYATGVILGYLQQVLLPIAIAGIIAYLLEPIVSWLERRKINRTVAVLLVLGIFLSALTLFLCLSIPKMVNQLNDILVKRKQHIETATQIFDDALENPVVEKIVDHVYLQSFQDVDLQEDNGSSFLKGLFISAVGSAEEPVSITSATNDASGLVVSGLDRYYDFAEEAPYVAVLPGTNTVDDTRADIVNETTLPLGVPDLNRSPKQKVFEIIEHNAMSITKVLWGWLSSGREIISGGIAWIIGGVLVPIFVFVFLKESATIAERWTDILPIRTSKFKQEVVETITEINGYLIAFFRGQMIVSLIDGLLIGISLYILGMPYAFVIGAAVGVLGIIPYVGIFSVFVPTLLLTWLEWHDWHYLLWVSGIFLVCNQFDSWVIQPKIVGNAVGLHEVTVIFSVIFWSFVFGGVVGALLAVPLTASVKVIFQRYVWMNIKSNKPRRRPRSHNTPSEQPA